LVAPHSDASGPVTKRQVGGTGWCPDRDHLRTDEPSG
jgi:hypothetical protein